MLPIMILIDIHVFGRIKIQCTNATLANIISVYPSGFTQSSTYTDPYDATINIFYSELHS